MLCDIMVSDCGPLPNEFIPDNETCVRECATVGGRTSFHWGYQTKTDDDACQDEWHVHTECLLELTCEERQVYWLSVEKEPLFETRQCFPEWNEMATCAVQHPPGEDE